MSPSEDNDDKSVELSDTGTARPELTTLSTGAVAPGGKQNPLSTGDVESAGFDPYDTASLYLK
jgi:hypothetical protein